MMHRQPCSDANHALKRLFTPWVQWTTVPLFAVMAFLAVPAAPSHAAPKATASNMLYVASNDPRPGMNAILAYRRAAEGTLTYLASYPTGGRGSLLAT